MVRTGVLGAFLRGQEDLQGGRTWNHLRLPVRHGLAEVRPWITGSLQAVQRPVETKAGLLPASYKADALRGACVEEVHRRAGT